MAIRILVTSQKGGVGKSTLSANLAAHLSLQGVMRTALLDFDHQATSSTWLERCGNSRVGLFPADILSLASSGLSVLKAKEKMRAACLSADIVIADLTWGDTLPPSFFLDYDLVLIPVSLSAIDLDSLQDFFRRFSNVFNSAAQNGPKIAVVPNRVNDIANYQSIFSKAAFPVDFYLLSPIIYSKAAQDSFGCDYLFSVADAGLRDAFLQVCTEVKQIVGTLGLRKDAGAGRQHAGAALSRTGPRVQDRHGAGRPAQRSVDAQSAAQDGQKSPEFLRCKSR